MREFSDRHALSTVRLYRRTPPASGRVAADSYADPVTLTGSFQPLGDTGRRQDRFDEHLRMGSVEGWRFMVSHSVVLAAGLAEPWCRVGDVIEFRGSRYASRGKPIVQVEDRDGSPLEWSVDLDGID